MTEQLRLLAKILCDLFGSGYYTAKSVKASETFVLTCVEMSAFVTLR